MISAIMELPPHSTGELYGGGTKYACKDFQNMSVKISRLEGGWAVDLHRTRFIPHWNSQALPHGVSFHSKSFHPNGTIPVTSSMSMEGSWCAEPQGGVRAGGEGEL